MNKIGLRLFIISLVLLSIICIYLIIVSLNIQASISNLNTRMQNKINEVISKEKDDILSGWKKEHVEDISSMEELANKIALEREKSLKLQEKLKNIESRKEKK